MVLWVYITYYNTIIYTVATMKLRDEYKKLRFPYLFQVWTTLDQVQSRELVSGKAAVESLLW